MTTQQPKRHPVLVWIDTIFNAVPHADVVRMFVPEIRILSVKGEKRLTTGAANDENCKS